MAIIINSKLGSARGNSRIWVEGKRLERGGFTAGIKYQMQQQDGKLALVASEDGQYTVSRRNRNGQVTPIIDLNNAEITELFEGVEMIRILILEGRIIITAHHQEQRVAEREERILTKLANGTKLAMGSLFHGGGVLDKAMHHGFQKAGIASSVALAVELESTYIESSLANNPELWDDNSLIINGGIQTVDMSKTNDIQCDVLVGGVPCVGASKAGRSKNGISMAEEHDAAGALFFNFLQFVQRLNPAIVVIENVVEYQNTASMTVIRSVLGSLGYNISERIMNGNDFGALENRNRLCVVATSTGLDAIDLEQVMPLIDKPETLAAILEDVALDDPMWKTYDYLIEKEKRDIAAGKGFRRQLLDSTAESCGTIGAGYAKIRSTEPQMVHPENAELTRIFTPAEHAAVKGIPASVVDNLSATRAHEVLGQSVIFPLFEAVAKYIGNSLQAMLAPQQAAA